MLSRALTTPRLMVRRSLSSTAGKRSVAVEEEEEDHPLCDLHPMIAGQVSGACLHSHQEAMEEEGDVVQVGTSDRMARIGEDLLC